MPDPTEFTQAFDEYELVPPDDEAPTPEDQLDAAELSALDDPLGIPEEPEPPIPFGRSWKFDRERRRFQRAGSAPLEVRGTDALQEWLMNAWTTSAGAHDILPEDFGLNDANAWLGWADPRETLVDLQEDFTGAAQQHDRVVDLDDDLEVDWDPSTGIISINNLTVITDQEESVPLLDVEVEPEI